MADIGYIALFLALVASIYSAIAFGLGGKSKNPRAIESARNALLVVFGLVTVAVASLFFSLVTHDFQLEYVANYTSRDMSVGYIISTLWAGNSGSLLVWAWLLTIFAMAVVLQKRSTGKELVPYASAVSMLTTAFFIILILAVANPFRKLSFTPTDGTGLNPLLENPGMFIHPITVLAGYVGFTIPFAFAVAALLTRRLGDEWVITVRRWTLVAWLFLGIGNIIGAWWAYVELGWGGYWAWDPVENASLMPWLVATAFLHSLSMQRRRGIFKGWNMVLIILTFNLAIFGTFLTRSDILSSVHNFNQSGLSAYFIPFISLAVLIPAGLVYSRRQDLKSEGETESLVSRESTFLLNNLLLVGSTLVILLGTLFPLLSRTFSGNEVEVGAPFFNRVNGPLFLVIILLAGICTVIGWHRASGKNLVRNFLWPLVAAVVLVLILVIVGIREGAALVTVPISALVLGTIINEWVRGSLARHQTQRENYFRAFWNLIMANRPRYGGYIVHIGIVIFAIGVLGSSLYEVEKEATLKPGESMTLNSYTLTFHDLKGTETPSRIIVTATLSVYNEGKLLGQLTPEKYFHQSQEQPVTEVAIRSTFLEDLYVILVGWDEDQTSAFKVLVNPLVNWLWIGGGILVLGGLIAFWPARGGRRLSAETQPEKLTRSSPR